MLSWNKINNMMQSKMDAINRLKTKSDLPKFNQFLNVSNYRTTAVKSINLDTVRKLV